MGAGDDPPGLGPDGDGRDVVGDGVVQLARQLLPLAEPDLIERAQPGGGPVADRGAEHRGEQREHARDDGIAGAGVVAGDPEDVGDQDDPQPDHGLATGPPAEQRVGEQQHVHRGIQPHRSVGAEEGRDQLRDEDAERDRDRGERVRAPPQQREHQRHSEHERDRSPDHVLAEDAFEQRRRHQHGDQRPVPPHPPRRLRSSGFGPDRLDGAAHHHASVANQAGRRIGRKYGPFSASIGRLASGNPAASADVAGAASGHADVAGVTHPEPPTDLRKEQQPCCRPRCTDGAGSPPAAPGP